MPETVSQANDRAQRGGHHAGHPGEQHVVEHAPQPAQRGADRGLPHVKPGRRPGDTALVDQRNKDDEPFRSCLRQLNLP
jgi:hypothetical protein